MKKKLTVFISLAYIVSFFSITGICKAQNQIKSYPWYNSPFKIVKPYSRKDKKKLMLINVKGNRFVNSVGDTILFRGLSIADPDKIEGEEQWNKEFFKRIKEIGTMIVRIPIHPIAWRSRTPEKYIRILDDAVEWCTELDMYIIIDWHSMGNLKMGLFQDSSYTTTLTETYEFWRKIAWHYKGVNTIAFYEIFNEPTTAYGKYGRMTWNEWKKINEDIIALIRAYDNETIPLIAGFEWAYDLTPLLINPIDAERIGYVTHPYSFKRTEPWEPKWEENFGFAADLFPVFATEFGFGDQYDEIKNINNYGARIIKYLENKGISWAAWVYDPHWLPSMIDSWDNYNLNEFGKFIKEAMISKIK